MMVSGCSDIVHVFFKVLILCLVCGKQASDLSINDFYPFGPLNGDNQLPKSTTGTPFAGGSFPTPFFLSGEPFPDLIISPVGIDILQRGSIQLTFPSTSNGSWAPVSLTMILAS